MKPAPHSDVVHVHANQLPCGRLPWPLLLGTLLVSHAGAPVWNARELTCTLESTCAGVSAGLADSMSDTMPTTWGVAMLVPWYWAKLMDDGMVVPLLRLDRMP